jgi:tetratricopeptide (TPR) repeat protein
MPMSRSVRLALITALAVFLALPRRALAAPPGEPRPLSEAERQAVVLAAEYLDRGPAAWWDRLARRSPLRRLGREAALAEIEVRAGSPAGAEWELEAAPEPVSNRGAVFTLTFPSGVDDSLVLGLVREDGAWKIDALRISAEPVGAAAATAEEGASPAAPAAAASSWRLPPFLAKVPLWMLLALGGAGALLLIAAWLERSRKGLAAALGLAGGLLAASSLAAAVLPRVLAPGTAVASAEGASDPGGLRSLLPLRRSLTQADGTPPAATPPETRAAGLAGQTARLWWAQRLMGNMDLSGADEVLKEFPSPGKIPLAELLRARAAFLRLQELPTAIAYQRAAAGGANEALLLEATQAFLLLGFDDHAKELLQQLAGLGARQSAAWYALAEIAIQENRPTEARDDFNAAWRIEPMPRAQIFDRPLLTALLADYQIRDLVRLGEAEEPAVPCPEASRRAVALPPGFEARLLGRTLRLRQGEAELRVPCGCELAPAGTPSDPAGAWVRERAEGLLARLPALLKAARTPGALAQPGLRKRTEDAAEALSERRRWSDLVALTDSLSGEPASLPPHLVRLRAEALRRSGRDPDALDLLIRLAKGDTADRRTDPETLYELADLFARQGNFDAAMKLVAKADAHLPFQTSGDRLRELQMEKRLAASFQVFHSPHFDVRYPPLRGEKFAREVAKILEAERQRLQAWIPASPSSRVEVHLLPYEDFRLGYSLAMDILGIFDGKIRVPFGDVVRFRPFVVSILTHELAHAMIAERTADRAPRWFQEGLAQHVEMVDDDVNPIAGYRDKGTLTSFPLIEPALGSYSPALIGIGYDEARWTFHYVEHRYGKAGIQRMLEAYRAGKTTDEVITGALGVPVPRFNQELWDWCATQAPAAWKVPIVRYDEEKE